MHCTFARRRIACSTGANALPDNRATEYRRLAAECLRLAPIVGDDQARRLLVEMARAWTRMADQRDAALCSEMTGEAPSLIAQQQQQILTHEDDDIARGCLSSRYKSSDTGTGLPSAHVRDHEESWNRRTIKL